MLNTNHMLASLPPPGQDGVKKQKMMVNKGDISCLEMNTTINHKGVKIFINIEDFI